MPRLRQVPRDEAPEGIDPLMDDVAEFTGLGTTRSLGRDAEPEA